MISELPCSHDSNLANWWGHPVNGINSGLIGSSDRIRTVLENSVTLGGLALAASRFLISEIAASTSRGTSVVWSGCLAVLGILAPGLQHQVNPLRFLNQFCLVYSIGVSDKADSPYIYFSFVRELSVPLG
jgi:hypothetical protein